MNEKQSRLPYRAARFVAYAGRPVPADLGPALSLLAGLERCAVAIEMWDNRPVSKRGAPWRIEHKTTGPPGGRLSATLKYNASWTFASAPAPRFIGIDIAKATLDWAVYDGKKVVFQTSTPNTIAGIKTALRLLKTLPNWNPQQAIFCMEHTAQAALRHLQCPPP